MDKILLLGIDIGTSGCKMTIFDLDGNVVCRGIICKVNIATELKIPI